MHLGLHIVCACTVVVSKYYSCSSSTSIIYTYTVKVHNP